MLLVGCLVVNIGIHEAFRRSTGQWLPQPCLEPYSTCGTRHSSLGWGLHSRPEYREMSGGLVFPAHPEGKLPAPPSLSSLWDWSTSTTASPT
jgi:hypothetical protein